MPIDDNVEQYINETNATAEAVKSLINIEGNERGQPSKVEVKTDLTDNEVKIHAVLAILNDTLMKKQNEFSKVCILGDLVERKERKLISKDRQSRQETVAIARQPDMNVGSNEQASSIGIMKRLFAPKPKQGV